MAAGVQKKLKSAVVVVALKWMEPSASKVTVVLEVAADTNRASRRNVFETFVIAWVGNDASDNHAKKGANLDALDIVGSLEAVDVAERRPPQSGNSVVTARTEESDKLRSPSLESVLESESDKKRKESADDCAEKPY